MAPMIIFLAVPRLLHGSNVPTGPHMLLTERSLVGDYVSSHASSFINWVSQPHILLLITVWWITFTVVVTVGLCLGFGPSGIIAGSFAAAFQSWAYGAFTPVGGIFATLTGMGMVGLFAPAVAAVGASLATITTFVVWWNQ